MVGVIAGSGSANGAPSAAFAAKHMAFKTTNGASDLKVQRDLELAGCLPKMTVGKTSTVVTIMTPADAAGASVAAASLSLGVGRDKCLYWEFDETKLSPPFVMELQALCEVDAAIHEAAFGVDSPLGRPVASANTLGAMASDDLDKYVKGVESDAPFTVIGVGLSHRDLLSYATPAFAGLAPRKPAVVPASPFKAGNVVAKPGSTNAAAAALLAPQDKLVAKILASVLGCELKDSGIIVATAADASSAKAAFAPLGSISQAQVDQAKAQIKTAVLGATGEELVCLLAEDFDPVTFPAAVDAVTPATLHAAAKAMLQTEPAVALITV